MEANNYIIDLKNITKTYDETDALHSVNLFIRSREFLTLLGPSGCGKTTMLRIIAGLEMPDSGQVLFKGRDITALPPYKRRVNTVFQRYALFPHLNVGDNIAFGLKIKKVDKAETGRRVQKMLDLVGLKGFIKRDVESLSGGQQQRVAIARALINEPEVLLLDEPLGALDLKMRQDMQLELKSMQQRLGITFLYVTHDQEEALTMSDTIAVMKAGTIQQIGTPQDIYNEPKNPFVADFIGESNITGGVMVEDYRVIFEGQEFRCVDAGFGKNMPVDVVVRPEDIRLVQESEGMLKGTVQSVLFMGVHYEIKIQCGDMVWMVHSTENASVGDAVGMVIVPDAIHIMQQGGEQP